MNYGAENRVERNQKMELTEALNCNYEKGEKEPVRTRRNTYME